MASQRPGGARRRGARAGPRVAADVLASVARSDSDVRVRRIAAQKIDDPDLLLRSGARDADEESARARHRTGGRAARGACDFAPAAGGLPTGAGRADPAEPSGDGRHARLSPERAPRRAVEPLGRAARSPRSPGAATTHRSASRARAHRRRHAAAADRRRGGAGRGGARRPGASHRPRRAAGDRGRSRRRTKGVRKRARAMLAARPRRRPPDSRCGAARAPESSCAPRVEELSDDARPGRRAGGAARRRERLAGAVDCASAAIRRGRRVFGKPARPRAGRLPRPRNATPNSRNARRRGCRAYAARQQLCETVETLQGPETPERLEAARAAWRALGPIDDPRGRDLNARFTLAVERCEQRHERWQVRDAFRSQLEALVREAERLVEAGDPRAAARPRAALEKRWAQLESSPAGTKWLADERALQRRFVEAGEALQQQEQSIRAERQQREREARSQLKALCASAGATGAGRDHHRRAAAERAEAAAAAAVQQLRALPAAERDALRQRLTVARQSLAQRVDAQALRRAGSAGPMPTCNSSSSTGRRPCSRPMIRDKC